jgi:hypothetical protein
VTDSIEEIVEAEEAAESIEYLKAVLLELLREE